MVSPGCSQGALGWGARLASDRTGFRSQTWAPLRSQTLAGVLASGDEPPPARGTSARQIEGVNSES